MITRRKLVAGAGAALIASGFRHGVGTLPDLTTTITQAGAGSIPVPANYHRMVATIYTGTTRYRASYTVRAPLPVYYNVGAAGWVNPYVNANPGTGGQFPGAQWSMAADTTPAQIAITFTQNAPFLPDGFFNTAGLPIGGGQMAYGLQCADNALAACCMRAPVVAQVGVIKLDPKTRVVQWTFNDPGWVKDSNTQQYCGPENVFETSDNRFIVPSVDGLEGNNHSIVTELNSDGSIRWKWNGSAFTNPNFGTNLTKCYNVNGRDVVAIAGCGNDAPPLERRGVEFLDRATQQTIFHLTLPALNEVSSVAYRRILINGVWRNIFIFTVWNLDPIAYVVDFDSQSVIASIDIGNSCPVTSGGSGWEIQWPSDDILRVSFSDNSRIAKLRLNTSSWTVTSLWQSGLFSSRPNSAASPATCCSPLAGTDDLNLVTTRDGTNAVGLIFQSVIGP